MNARPPFGRTSLSLISSGWKPSKILIRERRLNGAMTAFMAPWADFIFARVIMGDNYDKYTVAVGLYTMLSRELIDKYFTQFAAGSVLIAIPITVLFIALQRFYVEGVTGGAVKG